jgi:hypothetical protein
MDLSELTYETFADRIGQSFRDEETGAAYELVQVDDVTETAKNVPEGARRPFSLLFRAPDQPDPAQGIRTLAHDELGTHAIFLVPVARESDGLRYQAVFS